jgi:mRNA-degrading endonuclease RelE of RelBE toxin-antitoxin system
MNYSVVFSSNAIKDLHSIPRNYQQKTINRSESLATNPFPVDTLKMSGLRENLYRIRVGTYRIL